MSIKDHLQYLKDTTVKEVDVRSAHQQFADNQSVLIDIREKDEVKSGSPTGAVRISKGLLEMQIENIVLHKQQVVLLLCASGNRSVLSANSLAQMGYENVFSIKGGYKNWKDSGLPFEVPKMLNESDNERYKRHLLIPEIGEEGQMKLLNSKVLVVGAGGIGSPVAWYLAAAGIGTLAIIDDDVVDKTNLQRQILHTNDSVGTSKVLSAKKRLEALNPDINIITYKERLTKENVDHIIGVYDVVLDGTDNFNTRYLINDACVKHKIPNVHGSVFQFEGQVSTFWPSKHENAPCYRCLYPSPPPAELAPSCAEAGVLGVLPGLVGVLCATEAIKIIAGFGELLIGKLLVYNALDWEFDTFEVQKDTQCKYCNSNKNTEYPEYVEYEDTCTL
ncbi:molybdopterin-synthase adenylyltransferase MoeB [Flavivirga jejuensis]|uniref:Molybdopterin-synthase adenylyltransferase MoeB n=1 Tax=Flavivirga jejuensis TaxID=870487 RepID=A0ABT8WMM9_9FLAO|nr:molybdopterin-synthase adenylyltransferase MoeB [Flavivirga jejuensis]MDO5974407.1 molybdopterin-synthase adenylyltransferase MoeB [Flavivirga jejuensis]